ncbi:MAG: hypothetical protein JWQ35_2393 [Bacteriovoracaceae bacterium]|nr:hypothetical protein [Bacteriovoracaceae bacterium]
MAIDKMRRKAPLNILYQESGIRTHFPSFQFKHDWRRKRASWTGCLQPTPLSVRYKIKIDFQLGKNPKIFVEDPILIGNSPHRFKDGSLCLYHPLSGDWNNRELIAHTIIPWVSHWLWCYELWQISGKWFADEYRHANEKMRTA